MKNMKTLTAAVAAVVSTCGYAQAPPLSASYQWSLSGKQYVLGSTPVKALPYGVSLDLVTGWELQDTQALVWGPGLSYTWEVGGGFRAYAGASILLGPLKPDVALGAGLGFRF